MAERSLVTYIFLQYLGMASVDPLRVLPGTPYAVTVDSSTGMHEHEIAR
jgi:hypothetical protein